MKRFKLASWILLGMVLVFSLALVAWADGSSAPSGDSSGATASYSSSGTVPSQSAAPPAVDNNNAAHISHPPAKNSE